MHTQPIHFLPGGAGRAESPLEKHLRQVITWIENRSSVELAAIGIGQIELIAYFAVAG